MSERHPDLGPEGFTPEQHEANAHYERVKDEQRREVATLRADLASARAENERLTRERDDAIECDIKFRERAEAAERERDEARSMIAESLPFLRESWEACFHGQKEKRLSAEQRGMRELFRRFSALAALSPKAPDGERAGIETSDSKRAVPTLAQRTPEAPAPAQPSPAVACGTCGGTKRIKREGIFTAQLGNSAKECPDCSGGGEVAGDRLSSTNTRECELCRGSGLVPYDGDEYPPGWAKCPACGPKEAT